MVFSPNTFRGAPFGNMATLAFRTAARRTRSSRSSNGSRSLPGDHRRAGQGGGGDRRFGSSARIGWAVRAASAITLIASVLVLGGAFAAGRRRRIREAVILKTLGATRGRLIAAYALEFLLLGGAAAVFGVVGRLGCRLVSCSTRVMDTDFAFLAGPALGAAALAPGLTLVLGLLGTWRILGQKAAPILRNS